MSGKCRKKGATADAALKAIDLQAEDTVLIGGAAGGVGVFAVQLAKNIGARVIGTGSESSFKFLRELGAEPVTYDPGLADRPMRLTGSPPRSSPASSSS